MLAKEFMERIHNLEERHGEVSAEALDELAWEWLLALTKDYGSEGEVPRKLLELAKELLT